MGTRKVILLADDEVTLRDLIRTLLHSEGHEVLAAADGIEALGLSRAHKGTIDLLLTRGDAARGWHLYLSTNQRRTRRHQSAVHVRRHTRVIKPSGRIAVSI